jgi:hypothetical protein
MKLLEKGAPRGIGYQQNLVEQAAARLSQGLTPPLLREQGNQQDAFTLEYVLSEIDKFRLGNKLDARVKELQNQQTLQAQELSGGQPNFYHILSKPHQDHFLDHVRSEIVPKKRKTSKKITLEDLHKESKQRPYPRALLQWAEAGKDFRQMKKLMGFTDAANSKEAQEEMEEAIRRLKHAGVWNLIQDEKANDPEVLAEIQKQLFLHEDEYYKMREHEKLYTKAAFNVHGDGSYQDWDSSEAVTIFASEEAWEQSRNR